MVLNAVHAPACIPSNLGSSVIVEPTEKGSKDQGFNAIRMSYQVVRVSCFRIPKWAYGGRSQFPARHASRQANRRHLPLVVRGSRAGGSREWH